LKNILFVLLICIVSLNAKINSYVTVLPQKYFIEQIVGNKITIRNMIKNGDNIDTYVPSLKQKNTIKKYISLYFTFNLSWEKKYIKEFRIINNNLKIIELIEFDNKMNDEYKWLDPLFVKDIINKIYNNMVIIDPNNKLIYKRNYGKFLDQLDLIYMNIKRDSLRTNNAKVFVFDDKFKYFFKRFNLKSKKLKLNKSFLTTKEILKMKEFIKNNKIKSILLLNNKYLKQANIVSKYTGIKVINIDIFRYNWLSNISKIIKAFR